MKDDIKKDRSPNYPKLPLEQAVELAKRLYEKVGKAKIKREVAIGALGYAGVNGASLTTIATLSAYSLLELERGEGVAVSPLAIRLMHPMNDSQRLEARRQAASNPKVFSELLSGGFQTMAEDVLAKHLIQSGFTPDGAVKAASVFKANVSFAKLDDPGIVIPVIDEQMPRRNDVLPKTSFARLGAAMVREEPGPRAATETVLASYSIPLGANEATLTITGESPLSGDDFDALCEYVGMFKKQYQRKADSTASKNAADNIAAVFASQTPAK